MKRFWIVLMAVAMALVMAVPVNAAKPNCDVDDTHPSCKSDEPPLAGFTCKAKSFGEAYVAEEFLDFDIPLSRVTSSACIDVWPEFEGPWFVTVTVNSGVLRQLTVIPRDSHGPGDSCGGLGFNKKPPSFFQLPPDPTLYPDSPYGETIPLPYVNACGTDFAEWVGDVYYDTADETVPSPFALLVFVGGSKNLDVTLSVDLP